MNSLIIETKIPIIFFTRNSIQQLGIVEAELINVSTAGYGDSLGYNYVYYGYVNGIREVLVKDGETMDEALINSTYDAIKAGIPVGATKTEMNFYENSTVLIADSTTKFIGLNPLLVISDWQVKP